MNKTISKERYLIIVGIPLFIIGIVVFIAKSPLFGLHPEALSLGITFDLLLTTPLVYYLLIKKTTISKATLVPLLIFGVIVCSIILPAENQYYLTLFKTWVFPLVELTVMGFVVYHVRKAIKQFKKHKDRTFDFFTALKKTCYEILPKKMVMVMAIDIAVFYYGFVDWKRSVTKENEFTYHKDSGTIALLITIIFMIAIETFVLHILLLRWHSIAAWILTFLSIYSAVQIFGFLKSMMKRPIFIEKNKLHLNYGILSEVIIDISDIETIELSAREITFDQETRKLSPFGALESHNVIIKLNKEKNLTGLYGMHRKFKTLALFVDDKEKFKHQIESALRHPDR